MERVGTIKVVQACCILATILNIITTPESKNAQSYTGLSLRYSDKLCCVGIDALKNLNRLSSAQIRHVVVIHARHVTMTAEGHR